MSVKFLIGNLSNGGAERVVSNISLNMSKQIKKEIILFGDNKKIDYEYDGKLIYLDEFKSRSFLEKIKILIYRIKKIALIKKKNSNTTVISFLEYPNLLNALTSKYGTTIISVRNHMSSKHNEGIKANIWRKTIRLFYSKADKIIAVSREIKKDLIENYSIDEKKIKVIYNSYPIKDIQNMSKVELDEEYKKIFEKPVIITVGRLNRQKGQWHLIRAFTKVKESIPDAKLVILGNGELKDKLIELSCKLNIDNDVHFLGFQSNPFKFIAKSKVFVMTSLYEGFPNAMAEAMACGVPIISTDCLSGPREILAPSEFDDKCIDYNFNMNRYGILIPVCDGIKHKYSTPLTNEENIMADFIVKTIKNKTLRNYFAKQALKRVNEFDISKIIEEWEKVIE